MLIHKATMGVLDRVWLGKYQYDAKLGTKTPVLHAVTLSDVDDPEDWWEIPSNSSLAKMVQRYYPRIFPEVDTETGQLVNVRIQKEKEEQTLAVPFAKSEAEQRGYKRRVQIRPKDVMLFLRKED